MYLWCAIQHYLNTFSFAKETKSKEKKKEVKHYWLTEKYSEKVE